MATHLIFDLQGTPHLATETENGFLTQSGIFANSNVRFACPVAELEKRVTRFGAGDEVYDAFFKKVTKVEACDPHDEYPIYTEWGESFTADGRFFEDEDTQHLFHLSEARRLGLIPKADETK